MGWKKLVIFSLTLTLVGYLKFYHNPQGGFLPKKPKFTLNKEKFTYNNNIDTLAIYTKLDTLKYGKYKSVFYYKFSNNGCFFGNSFIPKIGINKSNLRPSRIGYYETNNKSIQVEYYRVNALNKNDTEYVKLNGIIKGDTLIFKNRFVKGDKDIYVKQKLDFVPEPSNW